MEDACIPRSVLQCASSSLLRRRAAVRLRRDLTSLCGWGGLWTTPPGGS